MQNIAWVAVLRQIPAEQHNQYSIVTNSTEISIQALLRIEPECVVVKGRLSGSQDAGRIFFISYKNIDYFGTTQPAKESDFNEVFGTLVFPAEAVAPQEYAPPPAAQEAPPSVLPEPVQRPTIRSEVLDRYRARPASSGVLPDPKRNGS